MDPITAFSILFAVVVVTQIVTIWVLIQNRRMAKKSPDGILRESQAKTHSIIYKAIQQANKIMVAAELKGLQLLSREKMTTGELTEHFAAHLSAIEKSMEEQLDKNAMSAERSYEEFLKTAEESITHHIAANQRMLEDKAQAMIERTESLFTKFTADLEAKVKGDVEKELMAAASEIEAYKKNRIRVIDERIVDILEDVLRVVLAKKMSLADQSDLVYKALEEAKREHSFGGAS